LARDLNIVIGGAAGQGVHAITLPLTKSLVRQGFQVLTVQDYQSRIRGGHLFNRIRVSEAPLVSSREGVDLLVALNQETIALHGQDLSSQGLIIYDASQVKDLPPGVKTLGLAAEVLVPGAAAGEIAVNAGACGAILGLFHLPVDGLLELLSQTFADKGQEVIHWNLSAARRGHELASGQDFPVSLTPVAKPPPPHLLLSGHEALALGALAAGVNFVSGYPMTPWTSLFNALSQRAARWGVVVEQAEDEIAAITMAIGASFAGARAMTGTSGGGFCLMTEAVGLAAMTETPLVVVVAMRPGPSTGLPTRTEQGDLQFVLWCGQGDSPRAVFAPGHPAQGFKLMAKAFHVADRYQLPVFILTDQYFGDTQVTHKIEDFPDAVAVERFLELGPSNSLYERYALTQNGISPRRLPGVGPVVVADSDEHTPDGHLTEDLTVRVKMHDKRLRKLEGLREELHGLTLAGDPQAPLTLMGWGSSLGPLTEAVARLSQDKVSARLVHLSELWPFPHQAVSSALKGTQKLIMVEQNASGQLHRLLRQETGFTAHHLILKYDGRPLTPEFILRGLSAIV